MSNQVMSNPPILMVYSGNKAEYDYITRTFNFGDTRYVSSLLDIRGYRGNVLLYGTYYNRKSLEEFIEYCRLANLRVFKMTDGELYDH